jgi:hypothetical protein
MQEIVRIGMPLQERFTASLCFGSPKGDTGRSNSFDSTAASFLQGPTGHHGRERSKFASQKEKPDEPFVHQASGLVIVIDSSLGRLLLRSGF